MVLRTPGSGSTLVFKSFLLFVFLIPLSQMLSSGVLVLLTLLSLGLAGRVRVIIESIKRSWDVMAYFIILALGLLYSEDIDTGLKVIETSMSLLALPLVINRLDPFRREQLQQTFIAFTAGLLLASSLCLANAMVQFFGGAGTEVFFFYKLTTIIDSHPTYLAYYLIAAITFGLYTLYYEKPLIGPPWIILTVFFLFIILLLTGGITAFVSILFVFAFFVLKFLLEEKTRKHITSFFVVITLMVSMFSFNELRHRDPTGFVLDDSWERMELWESALKANPDAMLGVGTGDYKSVLNEYYTTHGMQAYANSNMNAHNQFIETYFANGLLGLACLLLLLVRPIYISVRNGYALGSLIFFTFLIYGMTEVFLGRYQGVVFFALLQQCFSAYYQGYKPSFSLKRA